MKKNKLITICLVGAGQIGSRHLQALGCLAGPARIFVFDVSKDSLGVARERFLQVSPQESIETHFVDDLELVPNDIDFAIIATSSGVRRKALESLVVGRKITYLLLEKFLFPKRIDYEEVQELLKKNGIKAWVNCPFRMYPFYKKLKSLIKAEMKIDLSVSGSKWGLCSNMVHYLDLFGYLSNDFGFVFDVSSLNQQIYSSKREGYIELGGVLKAENGLGSVSLRCYMSGEAPSLVVINTNQFSCIVNEVGDKTFWADKLNHWRYEVGDFNMPFQSQLTHLVVEQVLKTGSCELTCYEQSMALHLKVLEAIEKFLLTAKLSQSAGVYIT